MRVVTLEEYEREGEEARRVQEAEAKERKETRKVAKRAPKPVVPTMRAEEEAEEEPSDDVVAVGVEEENVLRKPFTGAPSSDREAKSWPSATASFSRGKPSKASRYFESSLQEARLLESEHQRCTMRVSEAETRKKLYLMRLKHEAKADDLSECERERELVRKVMAQAVQEKQKSREEKDRALGKLLEMKERVRQEREQKENLFTIIQTQNQRSQAKHKHPETPQPASEQKARIKAKAPPKASAPSPIVLSSPEAEEPKTKTPRHHKNKLRQKVVRLDRATVAGNRSRPGETSAPSTAAVDLTKTKSAAVRVKAEKAERGRKYSAQDVSRSLSECEKKDRDLGAKASASAALRDKTNAKPAPIKAGPGLDLASNPKPIKRKFQTNGWSGTSCLSALPPNLLFGENFRVPKLLKK